MPSFDFKMSSRKAKIALSMNREGNYFLTFFDAKRKLCQGFVMLTTSMYHPLIRKQIPLATMEAESENSTNVELSWTLFNETD